MTVRVRSLYDLLSKLATNFISLLTQLVTYAAQHYSLFPLTLGQILLTHAVAEMHLILNAGQWWYDDWSIPHPVTDEAVGMGSLGMGGKLRAWFAEGGPVGCVLFRSCSPLSIHEYIYINCITDTKLVQTRCMLVQPAQLALQPLLRLTLRHGRSLHHFAHAHLRTRAFADAPGAWCRQRCQCFIDLLPPLS
jgi:hypothetical protein